TRLCAYPRRAPAAEVPGHARCVQSTLIENSMPSRNLIWILGVLAAVLAELLCGRDRHEQEHGAGDVCCSDDLDPDGRPRRHRSPRPLGVWRHTNLMSSILEDLWLDPETFFDILRSKLRSVSFRPRRKQMGSCCASK